MKISNQILRNLISLTSAEVISKIVGLITAAYLGRVLKPEGFGILGFATAFVSYFLLIGNFGLDTYGTREIAKDKNHYTNFDVLDRMQFICKYKYR
ncbi:MAG: oligosaccharide flippase family protein [Ignavibacteriaceae bacterium]